VTRVAPLFFKTRFVGACSRSQMQHTRLFLFLSSGLVTITAGDSYRAGWPTYGASASFVPLVIQVAHLRGRNKAR